jgi:hypothetical protein
VRIAAAQTFQGGSTGSNPVGATIEKGGNLVSPFLITAAAEPYDSKHILGS